VELEKTELALVFAKEDVAKAKSKLSELQSKESAKQSKKPEKEAKASTSTLAAQKAADKAETVLKAKESVRYEVLKRDYALLKELGMPEAKMPPDPVAP